MNVLLLLAHSIAEYDDVRMFSDLGYDVFSIGAYTDPVEPADDKRPGLPTVRFHADLAALVEGDQMDHKSSLPDGLIDWADVIIVHHFPLHSTEGRAGWIAGNWDRIKHKRVIWRTCGQSDSWTEEGMARYRADGLGIVRYSPREKAIPGYAGEDSVIRFGKYPSDFTSPWQGYHVAVGNVTQDMDRRGDSCGYPFWLAATEGLATWPAGPGSERFGGAGTLAYEDMRAYLRSIRAYLYTGTRPASYTLGLMEALLTGVPVVSIGPDAFLPQLPELFEGAEIAGLWGADPSVARAHLKDLLYDLDYARSVGEEQRDKALSLFDVETVGAQWRDLLGAP